MLVSGSATRRHDLMRIYRVGQIVQQLYAAEKQKQEGKSLYRKDWVHRLADRVRADWTQADSGLRLFLYQARQFSRWPEKEILRYTEVRIG